MITYQLTTVCCVLSQEKHKTVLQKTHQKSIRRATVKGDSQPEQLSLRNNSEFKALLTEQQTKVRVHFETSTCTFQDLQLCVFVLQLDRLRKENETAVTSLHADHRHEEFNFRLKTLAQFAETLMQQAEANSQNCQKRFVTTVTRCCTVCLRCKVVVAG